MTPRLAALVAAALISTGVLAWRAGMPEWLRPVSAVGGPFSLEDTTGSRVTEKDLAGRPFALSFGYTHCPDVCPVTLERMGRWIAGLENDAEGMRFVFVTVDPARDPREVLKDYLANFEPRIIGLTGSETEVARLASAYRIVVRRIESGSGGYAVDHTTAVYLMDASSHLVTVIGYDETDGMALKKLRALLAHDAAQ